MKKLLLYAILVAGAILFMYPFVWMVSATLAPESEISKLVLLPSKFVLKSYEQVFNKIPIARSFFNSVFVTMSITAGVLVFSSMIGYSLSRLRFVGRDLLFYIIIFTMTLPFQIILIPQYILMVEFGWIFGIDCTLSGQCVCDYHVSSTIYEHPSGFNRCRPH